MDAGSIDSWLAEHLTVKGGDFGPCHAVWNAENVCGNSKQDASADVLIDGATFHDYRFDETCFTVGAECHWECMYINSGVNITVRNSKFRDCSVFDIFATISGPVAGARPDTATCGSTTTGSLRPGPTHRPGRGESRATAVSLAWCQNSARGYKDVFIGFNSFQSNTTLQIDNNPDCTFDNVRVVGNLMSYDGGCQARWAFRYNVWSTSYRTGSCHPTDEIQGPSFPYADGSGTASMDYRLVEATAGDQLVPVSEGCPPTDIDGRPRPRTGHCSAGASER